MCREGGYDCGGDDATGLDTLSVSRIIIIIVVQFVGIFMMLPASQTTGHFDCIYIGTNRLL